ncbi:hypothetical protein [Embleya sp. NBC_00896]|uniref:hypothetical protein n=1 Tax=Embleya sp. NBC_00896 TaxID=2975961 RepID=UPI0038641C10|nr:hypothetical protein OG928_32775 [Embleya sp. NBC_00896]
MSSNGDDVRRALDTLSREAGPLREMRHEHLVAEAGRRRRRRVVRTAGAAIAMAVCCVGTLAAVLHGSGPDSATSVAGPPTPGGKASWGAQEPGLFTCGQPIGLPTAERFEGFGLSAVSTERPANPIDGPLRVMTILDAPAPAGLRATKVYPTVLVLRDGLVVGGPVQAGALGPGRPLALLDWDASKGPVTIRQIAPTWLCGVLDWQQVWADPTRYTVALVMTTPTADPTSRPSDVIDASNPLLIAQVKLGAPQ